MAVWSAIMERLVLHVAPHIIEESNMGKPYHNRVERLLEYMIYRGTVVSKTVKDLGLTLILQKKMWRQQWCTDMAVLPVTVGVAAVVPTVAAVPLNYTLSFRNDFNTLSLPSLRLMVGDVG